MEDEEILDLLHGLPLHNMQPHGPRNRSVTHPTLAMDRY